MFTNEIANGGIVVIEKNKITLTLNFDYYEKYRAEYRTIESAEPNFTKESILLHEIQRVLQENFN